MKIYTTKEASEKIKASIRTIQDYCQTWKVPKVRGKYQITEYHIKEWLEYMGYAAAVNQVEKNNIEYEALKKKLEKERKEREENKESQEDEHQRELRKAIELITIEAMKQDVTHKIFTNEEYEDVIGKLELLRYQEEQIQYLRNRIELYDEKLKELSQIIQQGNYIKAMEFEKSKKDTEE